MFATNPATTCHPPRSKLSAINKTRVGYPPNWTVRGHTGGFIGRPGSLIPTKFFVEIRSVTRASGVIAPRVHVGTDSWAGNPAAAAPDLTTGTGERREVSGGRAVPFQTPAVRHIAQEIASWP